MQKGKNVYFFVYRYLLPILFAPFTFALKLKLHNVYEKTIILLFAVFVGQLVMAENNIHLVRDSPGLDPEDDPRSITEVTASIDGQVLTVQFSELTASQIVVRDSADNTVFDQAYVPAYSVQENLVSLSAGNYTLYIYALGYWWYGQFEIE